MIGIMDSGFGGLSIYQDITALLPHESTVYIGDHAYVPYSDKTRPVIYRRVKKLIRFLLDKQAKLIVIACNTATVAGIDRYRLWFPGIPVVGVVPVIKTAAAVTKTKKILVLSTPYTAKSTYQKNLIRQFAGSCRVFNIGCPGLVSLVEKGKLHGKDVLKELRSILVPAVNKGTDVIALGCTHFPFLKEQIRAIVGDTSVILDSGGAVARQVKRILEKNKLVSQTKSASHVFYSTGKHRGLQQVARALLGETVRIHYAQL